MLVLCVSYFNYNSEIFDVMEYLACLGITIFFTAVFEREKYIILFLKTYSFLGVIVSLHALLPLFLIPSGLINFIPFDNIPGTLHPFSYLLGVVDRFDLSSFRISSFFTESNRLAYFILPLIFIHTSFRTRYSNVLIPFFGIILLLTKSFAAIGIFLFIRIVFYRKYRFYLILLLLCFCYILSLQFGVCDFNSPCISGLPIHIDRISSIHNRLASFYHLYVTLPANPFGTTLSDFSDLDAIAPTFTAPVFWSLIGGWISLITFSLLSIFLLLRAILYINLYPNSKYKGLLAGIISYILLEVFMSNMFAGLFSIFVSLVLVTPVPPRFSWI